MTDISSNSITGSSSSNPTFVTVVSGSPGENVTRYTGQAKIAVTGTAVQLNATSYIMQNGAVIGAGISNTQFTSTLGSTGGVTGGSGVTNATDGTGSGKSILPGANSSVGSGINMNTIYVNGITGDVFDYDIS